MNKTIQVPCKINLYLKILGKTPNNYHNLDSLFLELQNPSDELIIQTNSTKNIYISCAHKHINSHKNTLTKAFNLFKQRVNLDFGLDIKLIKNVPIGAGLGGGSADAAHLLRFLNEYNTQKLHANELLALAKGVGADVPFFMQSSLAKISGIGEIIEPKKIEDYGLQGGYILLIMPNIFVSTAEAFKKFDNLTEKMLTETQQIGKNFQANSTFINDFEKVVFLDYPILQEYKANLIQFGASYALLSGSGSSIFGFFRDKAKCENAKNYFLAKNEKLALNYL